MPCTVKGVGGFIVVAGGGRVWRPAGKYSLFSVLDENNRVISCRIVPSDGLDFVLEELTKIWEAQWSAEGGHRMTRLYYTDNVAVSEGACCLGVAAGLCCACLTYTVVLLGATAEGP